MCTFCYRKGFLSFTSIAYCIAIGRRTFSPTWGVEYSWENYIYSSPTLYGDKRPFVIRLFTSVLATFLTKAFTDFTQFNISNYFESGLHINPLLHDSVLSQSHLSASSETSCPIRISIFLV